MANARRPEWATLLASLLLCCSVEGPHPTPAPSTRPRVGGVLRLALTEPGTLDPAQAEDTYEALVIGQVFEGLVELDSNLNVVPSLARSWIVEPGRLVYHFQIRSNARFHNGRAVAAEDVVWSFERAARQVGSPAQAHLADIVGAPEFMAGQAAAISGLRAVGPKELTITLAEPYTPFLVTLATTQLRVVPREELEARGAAFSRHPIGTGPFEVAEWRAHEKVRLEANLRHWRGRPYLDAVDIDVTPGHDDGAFEAFLRGEVDLADFGRADRKRLPLGTAMVERLQMAVTYLGLNVAAAPFTDPRVRRAAALSIDRDAVVAAGGRLAVATRGIVPLGMVGGPPNAVAPPRDPEEARKLLEDAGHPGGRGLAVADLWANATSPPTRGSVEAVAKELADVGVPVRLHAVGWPELVETVDARRATAYFMTWVADTPDRDSFLSVLFHSRGSSNYLHYADVAVDSLLGEARRRVDPLRRITLYDEIERRVGAANVVIPLYSEQAAYALRRGLQGVAVDPLGQIDLARVHWQPAP
jgi:peptide/nickel transport system substrate-binding protein